MRLLTFALSTFVACGTCCLAGILTGPITNPENGHYYYLLTQNHWEGAEREAIGMGGHLVTIDDEAEQLWVQSTFATYGGVYRTLLIGLNDIEVEGQFKWASGEPLSYVNWNIGAPTGGTDENAVFMYPACAGAGAGKWDDVGQLGSQASWCLGDSPFHGVVELESLDARRNTVLKLDGGFVEVPDSDELSVTDNFTLEAWACSFADDSEIPRNIIGKRRPDGGGGYNFMVYQGSFLFGLNDGAGVNIAVPTDTMIVRSNWYHLAATYDGSVMKVYVNGSLRNTQVTFPR